MPPSNSKIHYKICRQERICLWEGSGVFRFCIAKNHSRNLKICDSALKHLPIWTLKSLLSWYKMHLIEIWEYLYPKKMTENALSHSIQKLGLNWCRKKIMCICKEIKGCPFCIEKYSSLAFIIDRFYAFNWPPKTWESIPKERHISSVVRIAQNVGRLLVQNCVETRNHYSSSLLPVHFWKHTKSR